MSKKRMGATIRRHPDLDLIELPAGQPADGTVGPAWKDDGIMCTLPDLDFGDYELVDAATLYSVNAGILDGFEAPQSDEQDEDNGFDRTAAIYQPKSAFRLNDDLEAEALRRRLMDPIKIPERRFGQHLSQEFALRFRYATSWAHTIGDEPEGLSRTAPRQGIFLAGALGALVLALAAFALFEVTL